MRKSKFVGQTYTGWTCTAMYLHKNYSGCTRHNAYTYQLERLTSDGVCEKLITVSGNVMTKIGKGLVSPEDIADRMKEAQSKKLLYRFVK